MIHFLSLTNIVVCWLCRVIETTTVSSISQDYYDWNSTYNIHQVAHTKTTLLGVDENELKSAEAGVAKTRSKRQQSSGAGKFTEAAQLPQLKVLRLFLTMFKNLWASSYTGGSNPFHPYVPKPVVQLYKQKILEFFFPDVGVPAKT